MGTCIWYLNGKMTPSKKHLNRKVDIDISIELEISFLSIYRYINLTILYSSALNSKNLLACCPTKTQQKNGCIVIDMEMVTFKMEW